RVLFRSCARAFAAALTWINHRCRNLPTDPARRPHLLPPPQGGGGLGWGPTVASMPDRAPAVRAPIPTFPRLAGKEQARGISALHPSRNGLSIRVPRQSRLQVGEANDHLPGFRAITLRCRVTQVKVARRLSQDDAADSEERLPHHGFDTQTLDRIGDPVDQFLRRIAVGGLRGPPTGATDAGPGGVHRWQRGLHPRRHRTGPPGLAVDRLPAAGLHLGSWRLRGPRLGRGLDAPRG